MKEYKKHLRLLLCYLLDICMTFIEKKRLVECMHDVYTKLLLQLRYSCRLVAENNFITFIQFLFFSSIFIFLLKYNVQVYQYIELNSYVKPFYLIQTRKLFFLTKKCFICSKTKGNIFSSTRFTSR